MRACSFDLETSNLNANFGIILCAVVKPFDGTCRVFRGDAYPKWKKHRSDDSALCHDIMEELQRYDIWIAHNGTNFDIPFLRTRLMRTGIRMPQPKIVDPVRLARRYLRLGYNSLEQVAAHFGIYGKTKVEGHYWMEATLDGSVVAMNYIVEHCIADVRLLEKVADKLCYLVPKVTAFGSDT